MSSFFGRPLTLLAGPHAQTQREEAPSNTRCPDFLAFLAIWLEDSAPQHLTLQHFLTTTSPEFADVSMGGASFEVRKVYPSTIPSRTDDKIFEGRAWVAVKHARVEVDGMSVEDLYSELATELQILRQSPLLKHENIIDLLAVVYHDAGDAHMPNILPALVMEWADFGNVKEYQTSRPAIPYAEKLDIIKDTANGLQVLHDCGLIHGDIKPSNLLVCRHPKRSFVVKLTDFGFALSETDKRPRGYTKNLEAPEIHGEIDPRYHRQLDVYSYGILVHTVFSNGVPYHESIPEEGREAEILRMKELGIYNTAVQVDFLLSLEDDVCPALLICKILAYSLLHLPNHRFADMSRILSILHAADMSHQPDNEEETAPPFNNTMYALARTLYSNIVHTVANTFSAGLGTNIPEEVPMLETLQTLYKERVDTEIEYWAKTPSDWKTMGPFMMSIAKSMMAYAALMPSNGAFFNTISSFLSMYGADISNLLPQGRIEESEGDVTQLVDNSTLFRFSTRTLPELYRVPFTLRRSPDVVKDKIVSELQAIAYADVPADRERQHWALLNLATVIIDDVGARFDLERGLKALLDSASFGNVQARLLMLHLYLENDHQVLSPQTREIWIESTISSGIRWPTRRMATSAEEISRHNSAARIRESFKHTEEDGTEDVDIFNSRYIRMNPCGSLAWRHDILQYSIINDQLELLEMVVKECPGLINDITDGETPVLLASRHGNLAIVKFLVQKGARLDAGNSLSTMPLHWLFRFPEKDQEEALKLLVAAGNDINAWDTNSCGIGQSPWFSSFSNVPVQGTVLHWAIDAQSLSTLRLLMDHGADPLFRVHTGSEKSAFAYACCLSYAPGIELFLEYEAVRNSFASLTKLTRGAQLLVQPLFWVTTGDSRWRMLMRNGLDFEKATRRTIELLVNHGASTRVVMYEANRKLEMSAAFSAAYHDCNPDVLRSGFQHGFKDGIDCTWGDASSGGSGIFLTLTHHNRGAFTQFIQNGADLSVVDKYGNDLLVRAAKETDDTFYIQELAKAGLLKEVQRKLAWRPVFSTAVYAGNFKTARFLYEQGFNRDEFFPDHKYPVPEPTRFRTPLGLALKRKTRGNEQRAQFLLSLPDREEGNDGFIAWRFEGGEYSALHCVMDMLGESSESMDTAVLMVYTLLQKYNTPYHLDMRQPYDGATTLSIASSKGHHQIVRALLEAGADPNLVDREGKTPLDHALERFCYPERTVLFRVWQECNDLKRLDEILQCVNKNTTEVRSILEDYGAEIRMFVWPEWCKGSTEPGLRDLEWVQTRLKEGSNK